MRAYLYSGTLEGLFSTIFDIYTLKKLPDIIISDSSYQLGLENEIIYVKDDDEKVKRIENSIIKHMGPEGIRTFIYTFSHKSPDKEMVIFNYLRLIFKFGGNAVGEMQANPHVRAFEDLNAQVGQECNRIKGFLRFKELPNGLFYAGYEPDHDITSLIMPYFTQRNHNMQFIIHDKGRNILGMYNGQEYQIVESDIEIPQVYSENEATYQMLWQQYFETVSIASRKNKRQQNHFVPRRYRKNMLEFQKYMI